MLKQTLLGVAVLVVACGVPAPTTETTVGTKPRVPAATRAEPRAEHGLPSIACDLPAVLLPERRLELVAPADGYLNLRGTELGTEVDESDLVFVIEDHAASSIAHEADAERDRAVALLESASAVVERHRYTKQAVDGLGDWAATNEAHAADSHLRVARADLRRAQAGLKAARSRATRVKHAAKARSVRAPFSGRVTARYADRDAYMTAGTPVLRLVEAGQATIRFAAPEREALRIDVGETIRWSALDGRSGAAKVVRSGGEAEASSEMVVFEAQSGDSRSGLSGLPAGASLQVRTSACRRAGNTSPY